LPGWRARRCAVGQDQSTEGAEVISKTGEYALRAVVHIVDGRGASMRANEIAEALEVPANYLSKILHQLTRAGILSSERGPRGGFWLAKSPEDLSLADVLEPLDPTWLECGCVMGLPLCSDENSCPLHDRWKRVREPVRRFFQETTLAEVLGARSPVAGARRS
jgi:Rrf2 family iron-sulfur cluster assembly transcriptional regulator